MVDSGAVYSLIPGEYLVDGSIIKRPIGDAYFELDDRGSASPVIYGEEGNNALLAQQPWKH
jgi:hypothetical protein